MIKPKPLINYEGTFLFIAILNYSVLFSQDSTLSNSFILKYFQEKYPGTRQAKSYVRKDTFDVVTIIFTQSARYYYQAVIVNNDTLGYNIVGAFLYDNESGATYYNKGKYIDDPMFIDAKGNVIIKGELFFKLVTDNEVATITPKLTHYGRGQEGEIQTYQIEEITLNLYKTESQIKNLSLLFRFPADQENRQIDDIEPYSDLYNKPIDKKLYLIHENKTDGSSLIDSVGNIILSDFYYVIFLKKENGIYYFKVARYGMYTEPSFGIANSKGEFLYEPVFDLLNMDISTVECSNNELAMFKYKSHYGLMNCNFKVVAEAKYESIHILNKTFALVKLSDRHWEFLNLKTNEESVLNIQEVKGVAEDFYGY